MEIRILGRIALLHGGTEIGLGPRKQRLVLAALIVAPGRSRSIDRLIDDLWPQAAPRNPKASLYAYVSRLRRIFDATVGRPVIEKTADGYRLDLRPGELDAELFGDDVGSATGADDDRRALAGLDRAFARWTGDPFADLAAEQLVAGAVARLWARRREAEEAYVHLLIRTDQPSRAVAVAREIADRDPFDESAHWLVMFALYRSGQRAEALRHYVSARRMLLDEVGLEPGDDLQRLERTILDSEPSDEADEAHDGRDDGGRSPGPGAALVGRDDELAKLEAVAFDSDRGPSVAIVQGESGIGKSRLLQALTESASTRGARVISIDIQRGGDRASLLPIASALNRLAKETPQPGAATAAGPDHRDLLRLVEQGVLDSEQSHPAAGADVFRYRVTEAIDRYLNQLAATGPVVVVVDDAQWASPVLLDVLLVLATRARSKAISFVVASRGDRSPEAASALSRLRRAAAPEVIDLDGLDAQAVAHLARAELGDRGLSAADEIHELTGGNPYFVHELLRVLDDVLPPAGDGDRDSDTDRPLAELELPASIFEAIHHHVAELSPQAIELLQVAALIDGWFDPILCAGVAGHEGDVSELVDQMLTAELVVEQPEAVRLGFKHDLVRTSIRRRISATRQAELHAEIGRAIADRAALPPDGDPGESGPSAGSLAAAAHHLCAGAAFGTAVEGAHYSLRAIAEARRRSDGAEARRLAGEALRALDRAPPNGDATVRAVAELRAELLCEQADAHKWLLDHLAAHRALRAAFQVAHDHALVDLAVRALRGFSGQMAQGWLGSWSYPHETTDMAERLIDGAGGIDRLSPETAIGVLGPYSEAVLDLGDHGRADALTATAVSLADGVEDRSLRAFAAERRLAFVDMSPDPSERAELCRLMLAAAPRHPRYAPLARRHLLVEALERGDPAEAVSLLASIDELAADSRSELVGIEAAVSRTAFDLLMGNLGDALERYEHTVERYGHLDVGRIDVLNVQLFWLLWIAGRIPPDTEQAIRDRLADNETPSWKASLLLSLISQDRFHEVAELAGSMTKAEFTRIPESALQYFTPAALAETVAVLGDVEKAEWLLTVLEPVAGRMVSLFGGTLLLGWAALPIGRLQGVTGNYCDAATNLDLAASRAERVGSPLLILQTEVARAEIEVRQGRADATHIDLLRRRAETHGFGAIASWCDRLTERGPLATAGRERAR